MLEALLGQSEVCSGVSVSFKRSRASKFGGTRFASLPKSNKSAQDTAEWKMRFVLALSSSCVERATKHTQGTSMTMANDIAVRLAFETTWRRVHRRKRLRPWRVVATVQRRQIERELTRCEGRSGDFTNAYVQKRYKLLYCHHFRPTLST